MKSMSTLSRCLVLGAMTLPLALPVAAQATSTNSAIQTQGVIHERYSQEAIKQALRYVEGLEVQGQRLMTEALQVALGIEPVRSMAEFRKSRTHFINVLRTLQTGDAAIGLPVPQDPKLVSALEALRAVWDQVDPMFARFLAAEEISRTDVVLLAEFDAILVDLARQVEQAYEETFAKSNLASVAMITVVKAEHLSYLIERMQTEMLLIVYGHDVEKERELLAASYAEFEETLSGLMFGSPELKLIPPPHAEIELKLGAVQGKWNEIAPVLQKLTKDGQLDRAGATELVNRMEPLYQEMKQTVALY